MITRTLEEKEINEAMFPVELRSLSFAGPGNRMVNVRGYYAIVDVERNTTLSVVSDEYRLVTNKEAFKVADTIIRAVFCRMTIADFKCFNLRLSRSRGSCIIDLIPRWESFETGPSHERWVPFLRIQNSYTKMSKLTYQIGFCRWICKNGCIFGNRSMTFSHPHTKQLGYWDLGRRALKAMGDVNSVWFSVQQRLLDLEAIHIPRSLALPMFCRAFDVKLDEDTTPTWQKERLITRRDQIRRLTREYFDEMGDNAKALFNVFTDYASYPEGYPEGSIAIGNLQRRAGKWVDELIAAQKMGKSLEEFIGEEAMKTAEKLENPKRSRSGVLIDY